MPRRTRATISACRDAKDQRCPCDGRGGRLNRLRAASGRHWRDVTVVRGDAMDDPGRMGPGPQPWTAGVSARRYRQAGAAYLVVAVLLIAAYPFPPPWAQHAIKLAVSLSTIPAVAVGARRISRDRRAPWILLLVALRAPGPAVHEPARLPRPRGRGPSDRHRRRAARRPTEPAVSPRGLGRQHHHAGHAAHRTALHAAGPGRSGTAS